jgi:hypothetical protein
MTMQNNKKESPKFDRFATSYNELLDDPLRNRFTSDPISFPRSKQLIIEKLLDCAGSTFICSSEAFIHLDPSKEY